MAEFKSTNAVHFSRTSNAPGQRDVIRLSEHAGEPDPTQPTLRLVHISDTHDRHDGLVIPEGDILVHSGDFTNQGSQAEVARFAAFLSALPHRHKVVIAGNHELGLRFSSPAQIAALLGPGVVVLQDSGVNIDGINIYGSSWNNCPSQAWGASESTRETRWAQIPPDTDVLVTHNPPFGVLDLAWVSHTTHELCGYCDGSPEHRNFAHWGCQPLRRRLQGDLSVALHLFGHVHDAAGVQQLESLRTVFSNAAMALRPTANVFDLVGRRTVPGPSSGLSPSAPLVAVSAASLEGLTGRPIRLFAGPRKAHLLDLDKYDNSSLIMWSPLASMPRNQTWWLDPCLNPLYRKPGYIPPTLLGGGVVGAEYFYIRTLTDMGSLLGSYTNKGLGVRDGALALVTEVMEEEQVWEINPCVCTEPHGVGEASTVIIRHCATGGLLMRQPAGGNVAWSVVLGSAATSHTHAHWVLAE